MQMLEIYVLCKERSKGVVIDFLENFLPNRKGITDDYPFPEYSSEPKHVYGQYEELIDVLEKFKDEAYSLYWDSTENGEIKSAMIFFNEDGSLIAGLVVHEHCAEILLTKLSNIVGGEYGFVNFDSPPPATSEEFIEFCRISDQIKLLEGEIIQG